MKYVAVSALVLIVVLLGYGVLAGHFPGKKPVSTGWIEHPVAPQAGDMAQVKEGAGSIQPVRALFSSLILAATPGSEPEKAAMDFVAAENLLAETKSVDAVLRYISVLEEHPDSAQAGPADSRANYLMHLMTPQELDVLEAALPDPEHLKSLKSVTILGQYHYLRATQLSESDPAGAARHIGLIYDIAWRAFQQDLDDSYKARILKEYLSAAEVLGKTAETREALLAHAETLPWSFTRWLIKAELEGVEPDPMLVPTVEGLESIRKYYLVKAREVSEPELAEQLFTKCRDLAQHLLDAQPVEQPRFDLAHVYLEAARELGPDAAKEAAGFVKDYLETKPSSIMRWIVRYEYAVHLTRQGASAEEAPEGFSCFEKMIEEADGGLVESVIRDKAIDREIRGLLACVWGHALAGTNRVDEAITFYDWVQQCCPRETHAGSSAAFSKAVMHERKYSDDPGGCAEVYEAYAKEHPSSFYGPEALFRVAEIRKEMGDIEGALKAYERVKKEYTDRSASKEVEKRIKELKPSESGS